MVRKWPSVSDNTSGEAARQTATAGAEAGKEALRAAGMTWSGEERGWQCSRDRARLWREKCEAESGMAALDLEVELTEKWGTLQSWLSAAFANIFVRASRRAVLNHRVRCEAALAFNRCCGQLVHLPCSCFVFGDL